MSYYVRALKEAGFEVKRSFDPDSAWEQLSTKKIEVDAFILDLMMLPGNKYKDQETLDGLITGSFLYDDIRPLYPDVPFVVLTNLSDAQIPENLEHEPLVTVVAKLDYPPDELAELTHQIVNSTDTA